MTPRFSIIRGGKNLPRVPTASTAPIFDTCQDLPAVPEFAAIGKRGYTATDAIITYCGLIDDALELMVVAAELAGNGWLDVHLPKP